jgi:hypothetical protein
MVDQALNAFLANPESIPSSLRPNGAPPPSQPIGGVVLVPHSDGSVEARRLGPARDAIPVHDADLPIDGTDLALGAASLIPVVGNYIAAGSDIAHGHYVWAVVDVGAILLDEFGVGEGEAALRVGVNIAEDAEKIEAAAKVAKDAEVAKVAKDTEVAEAARNAGDELHRPYIRKSTRQAVEDAASRLNNRARLVYP